MDGGEKPGLGDDVEVEPYPGADQARPGKAVFGGRGRNLNFRGGVGAKSYQGAKSEQRF